MYDESRLSCLTVQYRVVRNVIKHCLSSFSCQMAYQIVLDSPDFKPKWTAAVEWLSDELERVKYFISNTMVQCGDYYV